MAIVLFLSFIHIHSSSTCLHFCLPACLPVSFLHVCLSVYLSVVNLSVSQSVSRSTCLSASLPTSLPCYLSGFTTTHNPHFLESLRKRANARNISFPVSFWWPIHVINPVDKTKLSPLLRFGCEVLDLRLRCSHGQLFSFLMAAILYRRLLWLVSQLSAVWHANGSKGQF